MEEDELETVLVQVEEVGAEGGEHTDGVAGAGAVVQVDWEDVVCKIHLAGIHSKVKLLVSAYETLVSMLLSAFFFCMSSWRLPRSGVEWAWCTSEGFAWPRCCSVSVSLPPSTTTATCTALMLH